VVCVVRTSASGSVQAPFVLVPSDGVFGRFDLAALRSCRTLKVVHLIVMGLLWEALKARNSIATNQPQLRCSVYGRVNATIGVQG
jgi:hypothetical protein